LRRRRRPAPRRWSRRGSWASWPRDPTYSVKDICDTVGITYEQYIGREVWNSYKVHGGAPALLNNLVRYIAGDVNGQLAKYDTNWNYLIEYESGALTGNDAFSKNSSIGRSNCSPRSVLPKVSPNTSSAARPSEQLFSALASTGSEPNAGSRDPARPTHQVGMFKNCVDDA
jgi:hypothetical protein